jgi:hypothetical protein
MVLKACDERLTKANFAHNVIPCLSLLAPGRLNMRTQGNAPPVFPRKVLYFGSRPTERIPALRAVRIASGVQAESRRAFISGSATGLFDMCSQP